MNKLDIEGFSRRHERIVCIDSDGTAMDAMNVKHFKCHGPRFIEEWGLEPYRDEVQAIWNDINLYESTRGVNRFIALVAILERLDGKRLAVEGLGELKAWVSSGAELSNSGLKRELARRESPILKKASAWSQAVNDSIARLTFEDKKPFGGVAEFLGFAAGKVDIAIVSSSNMDAILEEWGHYGMLERVSVVTSQEIGTKGECLARLARKGYGADQILMIGDADPDVEAARANGVGFYPILIDRERESWDRLRSLYLDEFIAGRFLALQGALMKEYRDNFGKH